MRKAAQVGRAISGDHDIDIKARQRSRSDRPSFVIGLCGICHTREARVDVRVDVIMLGITDTQIATAPSWLRGLRCGQVALACSLGLSRGFKVRDGSKADTSL